MLFPPPTTYRKLETKNLSVQEGYLKIPSEVFEELAFEAFKNVSHLLRSSHLEQIKAIFEDKDASLNERFASLAFLKNANIASSMVLPLCQDTGTAIVFGQKGHLVLTDGDEKEALSRGIKRAYETLNLRYSQNVPETIFKEKNSKTNLPALIDIASEKGKNFDLLFIAKGGGSANKTFLFQETRALLNKDALMTFLKEKVSGLGVAACPPYHLSIVIGGLSAEQNLKMVKLASAKALDTLPPSEEGFRDTAFEQEFLEQINQNGLGAQFGGKHFCLDARVIRLPRHGASLPIGIGVSCIADRNILAKITPEGVFLEQLETNPAKYLPEIKETPLSTTEVSLDLEAPLTETLGKLDSLCVGSKVLLNGTLIVARDIAHARFKALLDENKPLPDYLKKYPIYYAGPAKTPNGYACGSFGPTTAGRMDSYVDLLQENSASFIMLAKGNRSSLVLKACQKNNGFYLGTLGGVAALTSSEYITACECIDFQDLGMEAVYKITVRNFPAFLLIDNKGHDFYQEIQK